MSIEQDHLDYDDLSRYQVNSRKEIARILQSLSERKQLVRMLIRNRTDSVMTSVLHADADDGVVVIDCTATEAMNRRISESGAAAFETALDSINIAFEVPTVEECLFEDRPAFLIPMPTIMTRLQRREFYRVSTPVINPARCTLQVGLDGAKAPLVLPLHNVSAGGIGLVDEKVALPTSVGEIFQGCRIDFPGNTSLVVNLQIRNIREARLANGKTVRRVGCLFVDLPNATLAAVQRYITKLEREINAKTTGLE